MRLGRGIGAWQLSLVREKFELRVYRSGSSTFVENLGDYFGRKRLTKGLAGWNSRRVV